MARSRSIRPCPRRRPSARAANFSPDEEAPVSGIRWLLGRRLDEPLGPVRVRLGTTRATNALLERRGARTALVTTAGFCDALRIGYQDRPYLFDLRIDQPPELYESAVELDERLDADGRVLRALDEADARAKLGVLHAAGIESLAVCLLHAYRQPAHEGGGRTPRGGTRLRARFAFLAGEPPAQVHLPGRHDRPRRLPDARAARLLPAAARADARGRRALS